MKSLNLTKKYILALSILGFLSILSYINTNELISLQLNDSKTINLSGKQRMLSQRINNAVLTYKMKILSDSLNIMEKSHTYLISLPMNKEIESIYFKEPLNFEKKIKKYIFHGRLIKRNSIDENSVYILNNSEELLKVFDKLTSLYQKESEDKIRDVKEFEKNIFIVSLLLLLSIGLFIFRPANRKFEMREQEILAEKNYSNMVIESNTNAIIAVGKDLKVKTFNKAAEQIFGYSKEEMIEKNSLLKIVPFIHQKSHLQGIAEYFKKGIFKHNGSNIEIEGIKKNGEVFPIKVSFGRNKVTQNDEKIVVANIQDITVEKEKSELLITNEKIYRDLFDSNQSIIYLLNPNNGDIVNANKSALDFYGYEKDKFLTLNITDINTLTQSKIHDLMNIALVKKQPYFEFTHLLSNKKKRNVKVHSTVTSYNNEKVLYVTVTDITDELKAKNHLVKVQKDFNNFFELSINLHVITDLQATTHQINNACIDILGYQKEELINHSFLELVHPDDIESTINVMKILEKGEPVFGFENRIKHKNGNYINLIWSANSDNTNNVIYSSAQNITDSKLMKIEKDKQNKIIFQQSKMASMGEMIENIAHQWRQPLSVITTAATGIKFKEEMNVLSDGDIPKAMESIDYSAQHLSQTIDDFRNFFETNKTSYEFALDNTFKKTLKLIESQFKNANITIENASDKVPLFGFENELVQVLINILNNARDELIKKEEKIKLILITTNITDNIVEIFVKDNAGGIPLDIIDEVFESHFTTKQDSNGTGVGLYMSKMILEEHMNGNLEVNNVEFLYDGISYKGAEFKIILPLSLKNNKGQ